MVDAYSVPRLRPGSLDHTDGADALVITAPAAAAVPGLPAPVRSAVGALLAADRGLGRGQVAAVACEHAPGGRVFVAPTGELVHWADDVRRIGEAVLLGVRRAAAAGARRPLVAIDVPQEPRFERASLLAAAAALQAAWAHPQVREEAALEEVAFAGADAEGLERASALERARALARDLCAGDPEHTAPEGFAARCEAELSGSAVEIAVERDADRIVRENPLLGAVVRASLPVPRHHPRIVELHYDGGDGPHLLFAGKGVTYDTGGADLKVGGTMAGMSMDKGGAAGVAGFFKLLAETRPKGVRATAWLGLVRNSIGAEAYVADEILTSRAGVRIVVGNTDAEGRMVLADLLAVARDKAAQVRDPLVMSVATLTGHVGRAYGPYAAVMGNGAAVEAGWPRRLQHAGDRMGDPFEWSTIRRDDYEMVQPKYAGGPIVQCNNAASVNTPRGHQFPFCFLERVSGLDRHDAGASTRIPYLHLDIATAATHKGGPMAGLPTGAPVAALAGALLGWVE